MFEISSIDTGGLMHRVQTGTDISQFIEGLMVQICQTVNKI